MEFKKGQTVTWTIDIMGAKEKSKAKVKKVTKTKVILEDQEALSFDPKTGEEINPSIPGAKSNISFKGFKPLKSKKSNRKKASKKNVKKKEFKFPKKESLNEVIDALNTHYGKKYFSADKFSSYDGYDPEDPDHTDFDVIKVAYDFIEDHGDGDTYQRYPNKNFCKLMNKSKKWFLEVINCEQVAIFPA
jgi:hypothetical protein